MSDPSAITPGGPARTAAVASAPYSGWSTERAPAVPTIPSAGVALLAVLLLVLIWAWRQGKRSGHGRAFQFPWRTAGAGFSAGFEQPAANPVISSACRLDAGNRLYVIHWRGQELLICVGAQSAPVVLGRHREGPEGGCNAS